MVPEKYRRLWRRRLRRRPLLPFVLAAFLAIDLVGLVIPGAENNFALFVAVSAVVSAQIGLLSVYVAHTARAFIPRLSMVTLGLCPAILACHPSEPDEGFRPVVLTLFALTTIGMLAVRITVTKSRHHPLMPRRSRYGIATLLWVTTTFAVLIGFLKDADWQVLADPLTALLVGLQVLIAVVFVTLESCFKKVTWRWIALVGFPLALLSASALVSTTPRQGILLAPQNRDFHLFFAAYGLCFGATLYLLSPRLHVPKPAKVVPPPQPIDQESIDLSA